MRIPHDIPNLFLIVRSAFARVGKTTFRVRFVDRRKVEGNHSQVVSHSATHFSSRAFQFKVKQLISSINDLCVNINQSCVRAGIWREISSSVPGSLCDVFAQNEFYFHSALFAGVFQTMFLINDKDRNRFFKQRLETKLNSENEKIVSTKKFFCKVTTLTNSPEKCIRNKHINTQIKQSCVAIN